MESIVFDQSVLLFFWTLPTAKLIVLALITVLKDERMLKLSSVKPEGLGML